MAELSEQTGVAREQVDALIRADHEARLLSEPVLGIEGEIGVLGDMIEDPSRWLNTRKSSTRSRATRPESCSAGSMTASERSWMPASAFAIVSRNDWSKSGSDLASAQSESGNSSNEQSARCAAPTELDERRRGVRSSPVPLAPSDRNSGIHALAGLFVVSR